MGVDMNERTLFDSIEPDICSNHHGGNLESLEAHAAISTDKAAMRYLIVRTVAKSGSKGMTCDEVELATNMKHQTCSARFSELKREGILVPTGERRLTRSQFVKATVFKVKSLKETR